MARGPDSALVTPAPPVFVGLAEAARLVSLPRATLRRATQPDAAHPLPHYRVGGRLVVKVSDLEPWMQGFQQPAAGMVAVAERYLAAMGARRG